MAANLNLQSVELVSTLRTAPQNGAPSSVDYYDGELEKMTDLSTLATFINNVLLPLLNALPAAAADGLLGTACYSDTSSQDALVYNNLTGNPLTITESLRLMYGQLQTTQTSMSYLSQQVASLQARLSASGQDDISIALQGIVSTLASNAAQVINLSNTVNNIQLLVGTALDAKVLTPVIYPGALEVVTVTWTVPFDDNSYVVSYGMEDASGFLTVTGFSYVGTGVGVQFHVLNTSLATPYQGYVHAEGRSSQLAVTG